MKKMTALITLLFTSWFPMTAQQTTFKAEYLKKLKNSLQYTINVAEKMPEDRYSYIPVDDVRTFGEQLVHIGEAMAYIGPSAIKFDKIKPPKNTNDKEMVKAYLTAQFNAIKIAIDGKESPYFEETTSFWAGRMSRRNILEIVLTHTAHHRAQAIVHLRMNQIKPPEFVAW